MVKYLKKYSEFSSLRTKKGLLPSLRRFKRQGQPAKIVRAQLQPRVLSAGKRWVKRGVPVSGYKLLVRPADLRSSRFRKKK